MGKNKRSVLFQQLSAIGYILAFVFILLSPSALMTFGQEEDTSGKEKRTLAPMPELKLSRAFPKKMEQYYNDNLGFRSTLIRWSSQMKIKWFNVSPHPDLVQLGKEGFLFYNDKSDGILSSYSHSNLLSPKALVSGYQKQVKIKRDLADKGIQYLCGIWPNKHTIYPENLPYTMRLQIKTDTSLSTQMVDYFEQRNFSVFDVRKDMIAAKSKKQLYLKFDTHWNSDGAYEAYKSFCRQTFSTLELTPFSPEDFEVTYEKINSGDLSQMLGVDSMEYEDLKPIYQLKDASKSYTKIADTLGYAESTIITLNEYCDNKKVLLVFRDSYTSAIIPFLSLHFYKVIYIWKSPVDVYMEVVDKAKPDVVICVSVERYLSNLLK